MRVRTALPAADAVPIVRWSADAWGEAILVIAVVGGALALRLLNLLTVPRFTDEQIEVLYVFPLYRLQALPFIGPDPYNGPLHTYLLAAALWLFGPQPETPRLLSALLGAATVGVTYLLGRALGGLIGGLVAAGLMATCATHVIVNSHVAWSSSTTPLFSTLAFLALQSAVTRGSGPRLVLSALAFALALQTHPTIVTFLPGAALAVLLRQLRLAAGRWGLLAVAVFVVGYANVLAYNLRPPEQDAYRQAASSLLPAWFTANGDTAERLAQQQRTYAGGEAGPAFYAANLGSLAHNLPRLAGSVIEPRPTWTEYLGQPSFWIYGALLVIGLVWPRRRGSLPLTLSGLSFLLLMPLFIGKFEPIFNGRYLMPLLPLAFAGLGGLAGQLWAARSNVTYRGVLALGLLGLVLYPLVVLLRYEQRARLDGQVNLDLVETAAALQSARQPNEPAVLDEALGRRSLPADGDLLQSLQVLLELRGATYRVGPVSATRIDALLGGNRTALVIFAQPYDRALEARFRLEPIEEKTSGRYALYRLTRR